MKLEDQVVSLDLSKKLKEIGVNKPSIFGWIYHEHSESQAWACKHPEPNASWYVIRGTDDLKPVKWEGDKENPAFSTAEIGELLPNYVLTPDPEPFNGFRIYIEKFISVENNIQINNWTINYRCDTTSESRNWVFSNILTKPIYDPNLANAMAKMLIHLIENGLIKNDT